MDSRVAEHLRRHPDFFEQHPDVLAALHLHHETQGAVSLLEYQVRVLRRQLDTERQRLNHLIARAREYDAQLSRVHALVLQLLVIDDPKHLCDLLKDALKREFRADAVALRLFKLPGEGGEASDDPLSLAFQDFLDREHALCGPLDKERARLLFGAPGARIRTAALVPIRAEKRSGVLAIGSADPERFNPDLGTDLLDRLGDIVSHKLRALPVEQCGPARRRRATPKS